VRHSLEDGKELTANEQEAARRRIQEAARRPYVYDPDSPLLSEKQLSEFRPVNFDKMEERERAMQEHIQNQETPAFVH
jgi:hypothetical protein